jgi:pimeloyl-ACP methyl ester carboxylesterase
MSTTRRDLLTAGAAGAAVLTGMAGQAQEGRRTFVLVHGAWHGGWCWRRVADILSAQGHRVLTPTLTGLGERSHLLQAGMRIGLDTHVADVVNVLRWEGLADVVLCGHSYGGMVVSGAAERLPPDAIRSLVFVDAFVPDNGQSLLDLGSANVKDMIGKLVEQKAGAVPPVPAAAFRVNERDRAWVDGLCTPQPLATMTDRLTLTGARERIANKTYIRAAGYPSPGFDAAKAKVSAAGGWRVTELPCGHDTMVDLPEQTAALLLEAA